MVFNITSIKAASNGAWKGDNPLNYAFPLLIIQTTLVLLVSGGILLGPSALGRNKEYIDRIFSSWSAPILETVASIRLLFFLFLVGLELDLTSIRRSGKRAFSIAAAGISLPFICGIGVAVVLRKTIDGDEDVGFAQFIIFMGVALSITAFPVLARILTELKLLTTRVGETAMATAAFNDVVAWVLPRQYVPAEISAVLPVPAGERYEIEFTAETIFYRENCRYGVDEAYICLTVAGVLISGFMTDLIGIHAIFGAFVFGLAIPQEGVFAGRLIERIEDFVSGLPLPLYFSPSGLKTDVTKIRGAASWGLLALVIAVACAGKILGTFSVALMNKIPVREALTLGLLMNTKGLVVELIVPTSAKKKSPNVPVHHIHDNTDSYGHLQTCAWNISIYTRRKLQSESSPISASKDKVLRLLACVHGPGNVPSLINLIESTPATNKSPLKLYVMHLVELTERSSAIIMVQRARKNGFFFINTKKPIKGESQDRVFIAFEAYGQLGRVDVRPMTTISALPTMHEDICHVAEEKRVTMLILPFHKQGHQVENGNAEMENVGPGWRTVNQRVLKDAPCSVAVFVDRGLGSGGQQTPGPNSASVNVAQDDREALEFGGRMAEHPGVTVTVVHFVQKHGNENDGQEGSTSTSYNASPLKENHVPSNLV
ncbi:hypothetical protein MKX01_032124 [Papaver californicum]|nr:hypothetical protein MKX01_032124 [Papaver californicum]